jgi:subtilisin family serine protease
MKEKFVILRSTAPATRGGAFPGGTTRGGAPFAGPAVVDPASISVEVEEVDAGKVGKLTATSTAAGTVLVAAPVMPMKLIEPVPLPPVQPSATDVEWGVQAVGADTSSFTGDGVIVAVLDTGIDSSHPAFSGVTLVEQNFTTDANGSDQHGHGTHCAGTIFGRAVGGKRIGVAPGVKKALIGKVIGANGGPSEEIVRAIHWAATEGAHVISMSLGMDFPGYQKQLQDLGLPPELATSRALEGYRANVLLFERLAAMIHALGSMVQATVIMAAAGNESRRDVNPDFTIAVSPPAVSDGIVSVAALGQSANGFVIAPFSNTGAKIAAPGVNVTSAKRGGGLATMSGTSMATPHVAGVAALWAEKLKAIGPLNADLLTARVVGSGVLTGLAPGFDPTDVGNGLVRAPQN